MGEIVKERKQAKGFLRQTVLLIPNFVKLLGRLFRDGRVPMAEKALLVGTIAYVISPLDFIPDFIPFVGQVDDLYLIAIVLLRLLGRTDDDVLREHWEGTGDLVAVVDRISWAARYVLPKRIRHILLGRVEIAPQVKGGLISSPSRPEPIEEHRKKHVSRG